MIYLWSLLVCNWSFSLSDHLKGIPVVIFLTAMIVPDALRAFAHPAKQGRISLQCVWHYFPGFHPGVVGNEGQAGCVGARSLLTARGNIGCKDVSPPLPSTPTAASDLAGTGSLKKNPTALITGLTWASQTHSLWFPLAAILRVVLWLNQPLSLWKVIWWKRFIAIEWNVSWMPAAGVAVMINEIFRHFVLEELPATQFTSKLFFSDGL